MGVFISQEIIVLRVYICNAAAAILYSFMSAMICFCIAEQQNSPSQTDCFGGANPQSIVPGVKCFKGALPKANIADSGH